MVTSTHAFNGKVSSVPAWKNKTNFLVSKEDRMIQPDLEREFAKKMKATTIEISLSHVAMISHPKEVADLIILALNTI
jgi:hypothetical protein